MKKFVNDPKNFVPQMLEGIALANPDIKELFDALPMGTPVRIER